MPRTQLPWKNLALAVASVILFFGIVEGILILAGVEPKRLQADPFVELASPGPLFVPDPDISGEEYLVTAPGKRTLFNEQRFRRKKAAGTYRVFCLGGSTTYGRPFLDSTSFAGWLRELLPAADQSRTWEVINAGGISYASYRVARVMQELTSYEPDLFLVYSGHNEFLEERTYSASAQRMPDALRSTAALLSRSRTWAATSSLLRSSGVMGSEPGDRYRLPKQVSAKLDKSAGLDLYERDDALSDQIVRHYRLSLERMVTTAREAGADLIFVTPAANLRSFSPFKSQYSASLSEVDRHRVGSLLELAQQSLRQSQGQAALEAVDEAISVDDRLAEAHFLRGIALLKLNRFAEGKLAFKRARDEDVCPLRAISPLLVALREVALETRTPLVDFISVLESRFEEQLGHTILGDESFLDHVHPTIEGHRYLALALVDEMTRLGILDPDPDWGDVSIPQVTERVEASLDKATQARALAQLAWTLDWAGKEETSRELASKALAYGLEDPTILLIAARHRAFEKEAAEAQTMFIRALRADPLSPTPYYQYGLFLIDQRQLEAAAAHFLRARALWPTDFRAHLKFGLIMAEKRQWEVALAALLEAEQYNPGNREIEVAIARVRELSTAPSSGAEPLEVVVDTFGSDAPQHIVQTKTRIGAPPTRHGVWTEWYETGELKGYAEYANNTLVSPPLRWDQDGTLQQALAPSS